MTDAAPAAETRAAAPARIAKEHLRAFVERIERLEEEKKTISDDIRDVYAEAKANGFDAKAMRSIVKLRKQDADERKEHEAILATSSPSFRPSVVRGAAVILRCEARSAEPRRTAALLTIMAREPKPMLLIGPLVLGRCS